jgi:hypothetical protein
MSLKKLPLTHVLGIGVLVLTGCDDPLGLPPPVAENVVDTVTIFALQGTPIGALSGFDVTIGTGARTESDPFDIAFDIDVDGVSRIFSRGALGLSMETGIQSVRQGFFDIDEAPVDGYSLDMPLVVGVDSVFVVRSRPFGGGCPFYLGSLPRYGKFQVLEIDTTDRRIVMQTLVNINCGYRQLIIGLPSR